MQMKGYITGNAEDIKTKVLKPTSLSIGVIFKKLESGSLLTKIIEMRMKACSGN
jgi:hypothetical protein